MSVSARIAPASSGPHARGAKRLKVASAVLLVLVLAQAVVLTWRWGEQGDRPASNYYEYHVQHWELQSVATPEDPVVWATLGGLYSESGETAKAAEAFGRALEIDPGNASALLHSAATDLDAGRTEDARRKLDQALQSLQEGSRYLAYYQLGELEEKAGRRDAAIAAYEASVVDCGLYWNAHYRLSLLYEQEGALPEALASAEAALRFADSRSEVQDLVNRLRDAQGRDEESPE